MRLAPQKSAAVITFSIESQNPAWSSFWIEPYPGMLVCDFWSPLGNVSLASSPELAIRGDDFRIYLRGASQSSNWILAQRSLTFGEFLDPVRFKEEVFTTIVRIHSLLRDWSVNSPRLATATSDEVLRNVVNRSEYLRQFEYLPDYKEADSGRLLTPHWELDTCTNLSMEGRANLAFWV